MAIKLNGKNYNIFYDDDNNLICNKIEDDGTETGASNEEIKEIITSLENKLNVKDKISTGEEMTIDEILEDIKKMIDEKGITDYDKLYKYINDLNKSDEDKNRLFVESREYLAERQKDPKIQKYKNILFEYLRKSRSKDTKMAIKFTHKEQVGSKDTCQIELLGEMNGVSKSLTGELGDELDYTDELKKELIEPVIAEVLLQSELTQNNCDQITRLDETRYNMQLGTENNNYVFLNEIEPEYKNYLQKKMYRLGNQPKISDPAARDQKIKEEQKSRDYNEQEPDFKDTKDNSQEQQMQDQQMQDQQLQQQQLQQAMALKRTRGFSSLYFIISLITIALSIITIAIVL